MEWANSYENTGQQKDIMGKRNNPLFPEGLKLLCFVDEIYSWTRLIIHFLHKCSMLVNHEDGLQRKENL